MTDPIVVVAAKRTPIGKFMGMFQDVHAAELGAVAVTAALDAVKLDPARVDEVIMGCGRQAGSGPNIARQVQVRAGIPVEGTAFTINMACASGLRAITLGAQSILMGDAEIVVAGGTESMSRLPFLLPKMRAGYRLGHEKVVDAMYQDGFNCPIAEMIMGETAELVAQELGIAREEQDEYAVRTQKRAAAAMDAGKFKDEIAPVTVKGRKSETVHDTDEHPRPDASVESMQKLKPNFPIDGKGSVHAGNASGITDGAAAVVLMRASKASELGLTPLARLGESVHAGGDPKRMGIVPVEANKRLTAKTGLACGDYDLVEVNEAFAAQVIACDRDLHFNWERTNVNGGAIALGHPIGATGTRIVVTLLHEMARRNAKNGLATLCVSGGLGMATRFIRD